MGCGIACGNDFGTAAPSWIVGFDSMYSNGHEPSTGSAGLGSVLTFNCSLGMKWNSTCKRSIGQNSLSDWKGKVVSELGWFVFYAHVPSSIE